MKKHRIFALLTTLVVLASAQTPIDSPLNLGNSYILLPKKIILPPDLSAEIFVLQNDFQFDSSEVKFNPIMNVMFAVDTSLFPNGIEDSISRGMSAISFDNGTTWHKMFGETEYAYRSSINSFFAIVYPTEQNAFVIKTPITQKETFLNWWSNLTSTWVEVGRKAIF